VGGTRIESQVRSLLLPEKVEGISPNVSGVAEPDSLARRMRKQPP
jgi:hypothetical protein